MARRNYTQELQEAAQRGAVIVCSVAPYDGMPMGYAPRRVRDPLPWCPVDQVTRSGSYDGMWRFSGRYCHAEYGHWEGQQMWYRRTGSLAAILVDVVTTDRRAGTAYVKGPGWATAATVQLSELSQSYPTR